MYIENLILIFTGLIFFFIVVDLFIKYGNHRYVSKNWIADQENQWYDQIHEELEKTYEAKYQELEDKLAAREIYNQSNKDKAELSDRRFRELRRTYESWLAIQEEAFNDPDLYLSFNGVDEMKHYLLKQIETIKYTSSLIK